MENNTQDKGPTIIPILPATWEKLQPLHAKLEEHKPRMREVMEQMDQLKTEMKMMMAATGYHKKVFFRTLKKEVEGIPDHGCYEIELDPPRVVHTETRNDPDIKKVMEAAKACGIDIADLLG